MLYYLFDFLDQQFDIPGLGLFQYTSFRAGMAVLMALMIALFFGKRIINYLRREQLGETVRDLGLEGQVEKAGTPTMVGIIIILESIIKLIFFVIIRNLFIINLLFFILCLL